MLINLRPNRDAFISLVSAQTDIICRDAIMLGSANKAGNSQTLNTSYIERDLSAERNTHMLHSKKTARQSDGGPANHRPTEWRL